MTDEEKATKIQQCQQLLALNKIDTLQVERKFQSQSGRYFRKLELRVEYDLLIEALEKLGVKVEEAPVAGPDKGGDNGKEKVRAS